MTLELFYNICENICEPSISFDRPIYHNKHFLRLIAINQLSIINIFVDDPQSITKNIKNIKIVMFSSQIQH